MLNAICTKYHEGPLCFDGGTGLYFTRNNAGNMKYDENGIRNLSLFFGSVDKLLSEHIDKLTALFSLTVIAHLNAVFFVWH